MPPENPERPVLPEAHPGAKPHLPAMEELPAAEEPHEAPRRISVPRREVVLPVVANLAALLLVAASVVFALASLAAPPDREGAGDRSYFTAEWQILEEFKRQAEARLREKDAEIRRFQSRIAELDQKQQEIREVLEASIAARGRELARDVENALATEKRELERAGLAAAVIEERLARLRETLEAEARRKLEEFKREGEVDLNEQLRSLLAEREAALADLQRAYSERQALVAELEQRQKELTSRFEAERRTLERRSQAAEAELAQLAARAAREEQVEMQLAALYATALDSLEAGRTGEALAALRAAGSLLQDPENARLPAIARRRDAELRLLAVLETMTEQRASLAGVRDTQTAALAAQMLVLLRGISQAQAASLREPSAGETAYASAFSSVPRLATALAEMDRLREQRRTREASAAIQRADEQLAAGRYAEALAGYEAAIAALGPAGVETARRASGSLARAAQAELRQAIEERDRIIRNLRAEAVAGSAMEADLRRQLAEKDTRIARLEAEAAELRALIEGNGTREASRTGDSQGEERQEAWRLVRELVATLTSPPGEKREAAEERLRAAAARDRGFRAVVEDVQRLVGTEGVASRLGGLRFLGLVKGLPQSGVAIVEPLTAVPAGPGSSAVFRRRSGETEEEVARGRVEGAEGGEVRIRLDQDGRRPALRDLVYLESY